MFESQTPNMLTIIKQALPVLLLLSLLIYACDKVPPPEIQKETPASLQLIPISKAAKEFSINLPKERFLKLNGSNYYDPYGAGYPMTFTWTKLSGPEVLEFRTDNFTANMTIREASTYIFELKVQDVQNNIARDTITVRAVWGLGCDPNLDYVESSFEPVASLDEWIPLWVSIGTGGNNIVLAGGRLDEDETLGGSSVFDSLIYVYNPVNNTTIKNVLSLPRAEIGIALAGNEVFLAGGILSDNVTDVIDILDLTTNTLKKAKLSVARSSINTVVAGHLVFFAGGRNIGRESMDVVDIYDRSSGTWSVAKLSVARAEMAAIASGTKVLFAGGDIGQGSSSSRIDMYDLNSGQWSTADLPSPRLMASSVVFGNDIVFDGGFAGFDYNGVIRVNQVDFLNPGTMSFNSVCMPGREYTNMAVGQNINTVVVGNKLYYLGTKVLSRNIEGESKWSLTVPASQLDLIALFASGGQLYGLSRNFAPDRSWYVAKIDIVKIQF
jgi:hypothetical protein